MNSPLDPRLLRTFVCVADERHFRRAAARLAAAPSAVSQQVKELERRVGTALLTRDRRGVALTEAGRVFRDEAAALLARADAAVARAREMARGLAGEVRMGLIGAATFEAMPELMAAALRRAPGLSFRFREMTTAEQLAALRDGGIDAGLLRGEPRAAGLAFKLVGREPVVCLLPERHRLAGKEQVAIAELAGEPILNLARAYDPVAHDFYMGLYRAAGFEPSLVQEVSQIATILFVVATTGCVALGPAGWRVLRRDGVVLRPLAPPVPEVATRLAWNPARLTPAVATVPQAAEELGARDRRAPARAGDV